MKKKLLIPLLILGSCLFFNSCSYNPAITINDNSITVTLNNGTEFEFSGEQVTCRYITSTNKMLMIGNDISAFRTIQIYFNGQEAKTYSSNDSIVSYTYTQNYFSRSGSVTVTICESAGGEVTGTFNVKAQGGIIGQPLVTLTGSFRVYREE